jgi:hypothetical protein
MPTGWGGARLWCLAGFIAVAVGCQQAHFAESQERAPALYTVPSRSLAFDPQPLRQAATALELQRGPEAMVWYESRRDLRAATYYGYEPAVFQQAVTITIDQQRVSGGRVADHISHITYRQNYLLTTP